MVKSETRRDAETLASKSELETQRQSMPRNPSPRINSLQWNPVNTVTSGSKNVRRINGVAVLQGQGQIL